MTATSKDNFRRELAKLKKNDRETIEKLTEIAREEEADGTKIISALLEKIKSSRAEIKVLVIYVIDSILKNVGGSYIQLFEPEIADIFASTYVSIGEDDGSLRNLKMIYALWKKLFKPEIIKAIRSKIYSQKSIDIEKTFTDEERKMLDNFFREKQDIFQNQPQDQQAMMQQRAPRQQQQESFQSMEQQQQRMQKPRGGHPMEKNIPMMEQGRNMNMMMQPNLEYQHYQQQQQQQQQQPQRGMNMSRSMEPMKTSNTGMRREPGPNEMLGPIGGGQSLTRKETYKIKKKGAESSGDEVRDVSRKKINETQYARNQFGVGPSNLSGAMLDEGQNGEDVEGQFSDEEIPKKRMQAGSSINGLLDHPYGGSQPQYAGGYDNMQPQQQQLGQYYNFQGSQQMQSMSGQGQPQLQMQHPQQFQQYQQYQQQPNQQPFQQQQAMPIQHPQQMRGYLPGPFPQQQQGNPPEFYRQPMYNEPMHPEFSGSRQPVKDGHDRKHGFDFRNEDHRMQQPNNRIFDSKTQQILDLVGRKQEKIQSANLTNTGMDHHHHPLSSGGKSDHHHHHHHGPRLHREHSGPHHKEPVPVLRIMLTKLKNDLPKYYEDRYKKGKLIEQLHINAIIQRIPMIKDKIFNSLYETNVRVCSQCGIRFENLYELNKHLDWHFRDNIRKLERPELGVRIAMCTRDEWIKGEAPKEKQLSKNEEQKNEPEKQLNFENYVPAPETKDESCWACGEDFETTWSSKSGAWLLVGAVKVKFQEEAMDIETANGQKTDYTLIHFTCYKSLKQQEHEDTTLIPNKEQATGNETMEIM